MSLESAALFCAANSLREQLRNDFPPIDRMHELHTSKMGQIVSEWFRKNTCEECWGDVKTDEFTENEPEDQRRDRAAKEMRRDLGRLRPDGWYFFEHERKLFVVEIEDTNKLTREKIGRYNTARWTMDMWWGDLHVFCFDRYGLSFTEVNIAGLMAGFRRGDKKKGKEWP